jgi:N utilization substance protein B
MSVPAKPARRRSREFALQALYQWLLSKRSPKEIAADISEFRGYDKSDPLYFHDLLEGAVADAEKIEAALTPCIDRALAQVSPVERAVLMIACCEFMRHPEVPFRVIINEAVDLTKSFGGTDGHKYVNGVLDKLALTLREHEVNDVREARGAR